MNQKLLAEFCLNTGYSLEKIKRKQDVLHIQKKEVITVFLFGLQWSNEEIGRAIGEKPQDVDRLKITFYEKKRHWQCKDLKELNNPYIPNEEETPALAQNPN